MKTNRITLSIMAIIVMLVIAFTVAGCNQNQWEEIFPEVAETTAENKNDKDSSSDAEVSETKPVETKPADTKPADTEAVDTESTDQKPADDESTNIQAQLEAENKELKAKLEALENQLKKEQDPFVRDANGVPVSIDLVDAEKLLRVEMTDGTFAYRIGTGTQINVTDTVILTTNKPYEKETFALAHHKGDPYLICGVDSKNNTKVLHIVYGDKLYSYNEAWAQPKAGYGFPLNETAKKVFHGSDIALIFADAICAYEDASSPWGYSLCLAYTDNGYVPSKPVIKPDPEQPKGCDHGDGCHCGNCDKCPALEPEVITKTEIKIETVEKIIEKETEVEVEKEVEVRVDWCGRCDNLLKDCTCSTPEHNERPEDTEKPDPGHNERPGESTTPEDEDSTQKPESDGTEVETPDHNDRPGETSKEEDSTQKPESDGTVVETPNHNPRPGTTTNTVEKPAHSPRP